MTTTQSTFAGSRRAVSGLLRTVFPIRRIRARLNQKHVPRADRIESARLALVTQFRPIAAAKGVQIEYAGNGGAITVTKGKQRFIVSPDHYLYAGDLCNQFDYYFSSTIPEQIDGMEIVDYSKPGWHTVTGSGQRLYYTSIAEDLGATMDYISYLAPREGETVLDIGAYCGLSVLSFSKAVGSSGQVFAFEPDPKNYEALQINLREAGSDNVIAENQAVSGAIGKLLFSCEGNMGSAIVQAETERGSVIEIESTTLRDIVTRHRLEKVGAVKLDIEGAEYGVIENSVDVIEKLGARWAIELHADPVTATPVNVDRIRSIFDRLGYLTVVQHAGDTAAAPTIFAFPGDHLKRLLPEGQGGDLSAKSSGIARGAGGTVAREKKSDAKDHSQ